MATILALSSWVAAGHVGLQAAVPALQRLGHRVIQLPTIMLSNHPGWPHISGAAVDVAQLSSMIDALDGNGWLTACDTVLTGYLPSPDHVRCAADLIRHMRARPAPARIIVDPILGDDPKGLYIAKDAAHAIAADLLDLADVITPNRFELAWLTSQTCNTPDASRSAARQLVLHHGLEACCATSIGLPSQSLGTLWVTPEAAMLYGAAKHEHVPKGVGDVLAALLAGGAPVDQALGALHAIISASLGADHLQIVETPDWERAAALPALDHIFASIASK